MPAPSTPVLDTFDRADAGNLGASWGVNVHSAWPSHSIVSNQADNVVTAFRSNYWLQQFGPDQEAYCTLVTAFMPRLIIRAGAFGGSPFYYELSNSGGNAFLVKTVPGVGRIQLGPNIFNTFAVGDVVGIQAEGPYIRAYKNGAQLREEKDYDIDGAGFIGFLSPSATSVIINDFGGGAWKTRPIVPDLSRFPKPKLAVPAVN